MLELNYLVFFLQMISKLRQMDESLTYGQICRVIKDVNSEIRQGRKESVGHKPEKVLHVYEFWANGKQTDLVLIRARR